MSGNSGEPAAAPRRRTESLRPGAPGGSEPFAQTPHSSLTAAPRPPPGPLHRHGYGGTAAHPAQPRRLLCPGRPPTDAPRSPREPKAASAEHRVQGGRRPESRQPPHQYRAASWPFSCGPSWAAGCPQNGFSVAFPWAIAQLPHSAHLADVIRDGGGRLTGLLGGFFPAHGLRLRYPGNLAVPEELREARGGPEAVIIGAGGRLGVWIMPSIPRPALHDILEGDRKGRIGSAGRAGRQRGGQGGDGLRKLVRAVIAPRPAHHQRPIVQLDLPECHRQGLFGGLMGHDAPDTQQPARFLQGLTVRLIVRLAGRHRGCNRGRSGRRASRPGRRPNLHKNWDCPR